MPAQTTAKPPKSRSGTASGAVSLADKLTAERAELLEGADELLRLAVAGEALTPEQLSVFRSLGWNDRRIEREVARMARVVVLQHTAGTRAGFERAQQRLDQAVEKLQTGGGLIREQIAELQAKLDALDSECEAARRTVNDMTAARSTLRDHVPEHVKQRHDALVHDISVRFGRALADTRQRLAMIEGVCALRHGDNDRQIVLHAQTLPHDHPARPVHGGPGAAVHVPKGAWSSYVGTLRAELPSLRSKLGQLNAAVERLRAEADAVLDHYAP